MSGKKSQYGGVFTLRRSPDIIGRIRDTGVFNDSAHGQPNHVIMNEVGCLALGPPPADGPGFSQYAPGQGIMVRDFAIADRPIPQASLVTSHTKTVPHIILWSRRCPWAHTPSSTTTNTGPSIRPTYDHLLRLLQHRHPGRKAAWKHPPHLLPDDPSTQRRC